MRSERHFKAHYSKKEGSCIFFFFFLHAVETPGSLPRVLQRGHEVKKNPFFFPLPPPSDSVSSLSRVIKAELGASRPEKLKSRCKLIAGDRDAKALPGQPQVLEYPLRSSISSSVCTHTSRLTMQSLHPVSLRSQPHTPGRLARL